MKTIPLCILMLLGLTACGGGGGSSTSNDTPPPASVKPALVWSDDPTDPNAPKWGNVSWQ